MKQIISISLKKLLVTKLITLECVVYDHWDIVFMIYSFDSGNDISETHINYEVLSGEEIPSREVFLLSHISPPFLFIMLLFVY